MSEIDVIFNNSCPICTREVAIYKRHAKAADAPIHFCGIGTSITRAAGLTNDAAARRFHVVRQGRLYSGLDAFRLLWAELPHLRWLARTTGWPVVRPVARILYDHLASPMLYALHRRRQRL